MIVIHSPVLCVEFADDVVEISQIQNPMLFSHRCLTDLSQDTFVKQETSVSHMFLYFLSHLRFGSSDTTDVIFSVV